MILLKYEQNCSSKTTPRVRTSSQCTVIEMHTPSPDQRSGIVLISKRPLSSSGNEALFFSRTTSGNTKLNESSHWNHVSKHPEPRYDRENFIDPQKCHNPKRSVCRHTEPLPKYHTMPSVSQPQRTSTELQAKEKATMQTTQKAANKKTTFTVRHRILLPFFTQTAGGFSNASKVYKTMMILSIKT